MKRDDSIECESSLMTEGEIMNLRNSLTEHINKELKSHVCSLNNKEWTLAELTQNLYLVFNIFNQLFFNSLLSIPVISITKLRITMLGCFTYGRNSFGAKKYIQINSKHLNRLKIEVYGTLLHEALHQAEQEIHCKKKANRGNYHSAFFRMQAAKYGIPCDDKGCSLPIVKCSPFVETLIKHSIVSQDDLDFQETVIQKVVNSEIPKSKLLKFSCSCTNIRVVDLKFHAKCLNCGEEFKLNEPCFKGYWK